MALNFQYALVEVINCALKIKQIHAETLRRMMQRNVTQYDAFVREKKHNPGMASCNLLRWKKLQ